jgi:hypothetical protein
MTNLLATALAFAHCVQRGDDDLICEHEQSVILGGEAGHA